jgi:hypothetical protein
LYSGEVVLLLLLLMLLLLLLLLLPLLLLMFLLHTAHIWLSCGLGRDWVRFHCK